MAGANRALYDDSIKEFCNSNIDSIFGQLCDNYHGDALTTTRDAWRKEIIILKRVLAPFTALGGHIIFEYSIPRLGKRIDAVLLIKNIIFCLEFKVGKKEKSQQDIDQVIDYALDLKNFHFFSKDNIIAPILIPTSYDGKASDLCLSIFKDQILNPIVIGENELEKAISSIISKYGSEQQVIDGKKWIISPYSPTPTIIEAAKALYESHTVEDITRHEADKVSTDATIKAIMDIIQTSKANGEKSICFVTGVPGAGKTLVGLEVAVRQTYIETEPCQGDEGAVYLSGNGPLVAVLTEALAVDNNNKSIISGIKKGISDSRREVGKFIQIIHKYRDNMLAKIKNPIENGTLEIDPEKAIKMKDSGYGEVEHVAIFDEAQRSWTHKRLSDYLSRGGTYGNKLKVENFPMSEAAFLIWSLNQRSDWATIVCLVGGGQEINTGEGGIGEWIKALNDHFDKWKIYISDQLTEPEYAEGKVNQLLSKNKNVTFRPDLHLGVSLRSFRAEKLSTFIHSMLTFDGNAATLYSEIKEKYPIFITRSIEKVRRWLRNNTRGSERSGLLVSKTAARIEPLAIRVLPKDDDSVVKWFLQDKFNIRSSNYLETAATEIQVQGLELDYTCVVWDADMRYSDGKWSYYLFNGKNAWVEQDPLDESKAEQTKYMLNAYRVLLTRARSGMVICIPEGNASKTIDGYWEDGTRLPEYYDSTFLYLKSLGLEEL